LPHLGKGHAHIVQLTSCRRAPSFASARVPPCDPPNAIGLANIYGQARPTYPPELVRWCLEQVPAPGVIVDLGCGTGISTRLFASTGHPVIGIDPQRGYVGHDTRGPSTDIGADRTPYLRIDHSISFHATRSETMCILF